jgi:hypothetical protein
MQDILMVSIMLQQKQNHFRPHESLKDIAAVKLKKYIKSLTGTPPSKGFNVVASNGENPKPGVTTTAGNTLTWCNYNPSEH